MADKALAETRAWVERAVIGMNLCPFAKAPQAKGQVRYVLCMATGTEALSASLTAELQHLAQTPAEQTETTLLVHPQVLGDFDAYNDFLDVADSTVAALGLEGVIQVASFHPQYRFGGSEAGDVSNATNQSPYPTLHLLREASVERAVAAFPKAEAIFEANIATLQRLGTQGWAALRAQCRKDADNADRADETGNAA